MNTNGGPLQDDLNALLLKYGATSIKVEWRTDPGEPGDMRIEQQERDWDRDEAEALDDTYATDPGRVDV